MIRVYGTGEPLIVFDILVGGEGAVVAVLLVAQAVRLEERHSHEEPSVLANALGQAQVGVDG